jgi:acyl transferase domain-containing protein
MTAPVEDVETVAVIGMAGRFPKARNLAEFWRNLEEGVECISLFGEQAGAPRAGANHRHHVGAGGVLEDLDLFDAQFFGFSARDAEGTDPQHRLFLECAWEGLEDAGYIPDQYPGQIGVFAGAALSTYIADLYADANVYTKYDDMQIGIGNDKDHLTTQVSYKLNLKGPSVTVQTACSTSLVAVCLACQSLLNYESDMALAGGVAAQVGTDEGYFYQPGGILSPDGHCRPFDAEAQGTVGGNGVGVVVLKRLSEAKRDRDHIRALLRGFALNNDGSRKVGYTAPSVSGQAEVISMAHALAGVDPESITYVEAHGTGTSLGDPIEVAALQEVFGRGSSRRGYCALGSVKSNIGHLDTAAGIAGLIKTILAVEHGFIPPSLHFRKPNPEIPFATTAFFVNSALRRWEPDTGPRRAGVSSFGIGGTNAHVVVEEAPRDPTGSLEQHNHLRPYSLLTISAQSLAALENATDDLATHLEAERPPHLADVAFTQRVGRKAFLQRRALVWPTNDVAGAATVLRQRDSQRLLTGRSFAQTPPVYFMFPGQGAQYTGMGAQLYATERHFRHDIDRCGEIVRPRLEMDLRELLYPSCPEHHGPETALHQTRYTQPALFAVEYALARLWMDWGIQPAGMIGHSIGEYVAACLAGVFSLEEALNLVTMRGELMGSMPPGGMLAVPLPEASLQRYVSCGLSVAAINTPLSTVLSGANDVLAEVEAELRHAKVNYVRLRVPHAFHSHMMEPAARKLAEHVRSLQIRAPAIPYISNVTGAWATPELVMEPEYWGRHLRTTVRFSDGLASLHDGRDCVLLEVGPGTTLAGLARQQAAEFSGQLALSSLGNPGSNQPEAAALLRSLARLWIAGVEDDPAGFYNHEPRRRVSLPTYPFERQRYRTVPPDTPQAIYPEETGDDGFVNIHDWFYYPSWRPAGSPSHVAVGPPASDRPSWLIFDDGGPIGAGVIAQLKANGQVTTVKRGAHFTQIAPSEYALNLSQASHYDALLQALDDEGGCPGVAVHLWGLTTRAEATDMSPTDHVAHGLLSVNQLAQAVHRARTIKERFVINVVTNQVQSVNGREELCPAKASVLGACRVLPQEFPRLTTRAIDVDDDCFEPSRVASVVDTLVTEILSEPDDSVVALRRGYRWIQIFEPACFDDENVEASRLRDGGTYLITGALGKVGFVLASYLARTRRANLVLTGRTALPHPDVWTEVLESSPADPESAGVRQLRELQSLGAQVIYVAADVADPDAMCGVVAVAEERFGTIHGVIHAAGLGAGLTEGPVWGSDVSIATAQSQLSPKAGGLAALDIALQGRHPDFVLTMSSLATILGGLGDMEYVAANCVMDAMSTDHNRDGGVPWITVDWDAWELPAGEIPAMQAAEGTRILPWQGEAAFERIVNRAPGHVIVSVRDMNSNFDEWILAQQQTSPLDLPPPDEGFHDRPELAAPYLPPQSATEIALTEIWQGLLGIAPVGTADNFFELGGHSLLAIQVISRISEHFDVDLSVAKVFEAPTIAVLAEIIDAEGESGSLPLERAAELLDIVEQLSETELEALLETADRSSPGVVRDE